MVHSAPKKWAYWLPQAEYWYNTNYHSALGKTPFQVLYGYQPRHLGVANLQSSTSSDLSTWLAERNAMTSAIREHLLQAQQRMKAQKDKHRSDRVFAAGDWVFLKLQPYMQQSVARRTYHKLGFKYFGPYQVLEKVGDVAYRLQLPESNKIHPVVHVSLLKPARPPEKQVPTSDSLQYAQVCPAVAKPYQVLDSCLVRFGGCTRKQFKVAWSGLPTTMATWEWASVLSELSMT